MNNCIISMNNCIIWILSELKIPPINNTNYTKLDEEFANFIIFIIIIFAILIIMII